jgi:Tfp pilus assembly protein PilV
MKHGISVLLLAIIVLTIAQTQRNAQAQGTDGTAQLLTGLENKWVAALMQSDTNTLDSILSDT